MCPVGRMHGSGNQEVEAGMTLLNVSLSDPLETFVLPIQVTVFFRVRGSVYQQGHTVARGRARMLLNCKLWLPHGHFKLLWSRHKQAKQRITILTEKTVPECEER